MRPIALAWRSLTRQPLRTWLGISGIAVVGALLFNMLLLSRGLDISFRQILDRAGFDIRVTANEAFPARGRRIADTPAALAKIRALPVVADVVAVRFGKAELLIEEDDPVRVSFMGSGGPARSTWIVLEGRDLSFEASEKQPEILVNRLLADRLDLSPGDAVRLRGDCNRRRNAALPPVTFRVAGIVRFPFDPIDDFTTVATLDQMLRTCDVTDPRASDLLLVASAPEDGPDVAVSAIEAALPDLYSFSNSEFVEQVSARQFSYFRQISFALSTITLFFAFLLITTLLTVSVNQRLGEVAVLRALGFRRGRIIADLLWESTLIVASGGLLALPLGGLLALQLDAILRAMPGIPADLHFFVFQTRAVVFYVALLVVTGVLAAGYPVYLAARLPIAATLRREVVG